MTMDEAVEELANRTNSPRGLAEGDSYRRSDRNRQDVRESWLWPSIAAGQGLAGEATHPAGR